MKRAALLALLAIPITTAPALADSFQRVTDRGEFEQLIRNRALTRLGIRVQVTTDGGIIGRAFGQDVSGDWNWQGGYFCRDLYLSGKELDLGNCQTVEVDDDGNTLRFTSDRGTGDYADLKLN